MCPLATQIKQFCFLLSMINARFIPDLLYLHVITENKVALYSYLPKKSLFQNAWRLYVCRGTKSIEGADWPWRQMTTLTAINTTFKTKWETVRNGTKRILLLVDIMCPETQYAHWSTCSGILGFVNMPTVYSSVLLGVSLIGFEVIVPLIEQLEHHFSNDVDLVWTYINVTMCLSTTLAMRGHCLCIIDIVARVSYSLLRYR